MARIVYKFTLKNEDGETSSHYFFNYTAGWDFARREQADYSNACDGRLTVVVEWNWTETEDLDWVIKPNGEIIWEE